MAALACPFKPIPTRERIGPAVPAVHIHRYECEISLEDPALWVQDCACGHRRLVRKGPHGEIVREYDDAMVPDGSSWEHGIFVYQRNGTWIDQWAIHALTKGDDHVTSLAQ
jgi:hypothetical protein